MALPLDKSKISQSLGGQTIVVIEPASNYRRTIKQYLNTLGLKNIVLCSDAEQSLTEIEGPIGLIICEWQLKSKNGLQLCRELRGIDRFKHIPFLLTSTENLRSDIILASEVGVDAYLLKPFSYESFSLLIQRLANYKANRADIHLYLDVADENCRLGQIENALELYNKVLELEYHSARAWCGLAVLHHQQRDNTEALRCLEKSLSINPIYIKALREMLAIYDEQDNLHGVLHILQKLHSESPDNPSYTVQSALVYLRLGFLKESEDFFRKTIRLSPRMASAYRGLGDVFMKKEDYEMAMKHYSKALDLDSGDIKTLNALGLSLIRLKRFDEGIAKYLMALELDQNHPGLHFNLGFAYEKQENMLKAMEHYSRALIADPTFEKAKRRLEILKRGTAA